jgi:hypothetical protein
MKGSKLLAVVVVGIFLLSVAGLAYAADAQSTAKDAIKSQHNEMKASADAAKSEEAALKSQIKDAKKSGDTEKAKSLRSELRTTHQQNVAERRQDVKDVHAQRKELKQDRRAARQERRGL